MQVKSSSLNRPAAIRNPHTCARRTTQQRQQSTETYFQPMPTEQDHVFYHEFGLASGRVCQRPQQERGGVWFRTDDEELVEWLKKACQPLVVGEHPMHHLRYP